MPQKDSTEEEIPLYDEYFYEDYDRLNIEPDGASGKKIVVKSPQQKKIEDSSCKKKYVAAFAKKGKVRKFSL